MAHLVGGENVVVGETAVLVDGERLPDETGLNLESGVGREVVGGEVEEVVFGSRRGEDSFRTHELVVEGEVPSGYHILSVSDMDEVVFLQRAVV